MTYFCGSCTRFDKDDNNEKKEPPLSTESCGKENNQNGEIHAKYF